MSEYPDAAIAVCMPDRHRDGIVGMPDFDVEPALGRDRARPDA